MKTMEEIIRANPMKPYSKAESTRAAYGNALARLGEFEKLFVIDADLRASVKTGAFAEKYPERHENVGIQEMFMLNFAAGLASCGRIPITNTFAMFYARAFEAVLQSISKTGLNVKMIGTHAGIYTGEDGISHQAISDVAIMRSLPNLVVIEPSDAMQTEKMFEAMLKDPRPTYLRLGRNKTDLIYSEHKSFGLNLKSYESFPIGKGFTVYPADDTRIVDVTFIASGKMVSEALKVAKMTTYDIRVIDMPTIEPLDEGIVEYAMRTSKGIKKNNVKIMVAQDHIVRGGLGDAVCSAVAKTNLPGSVEVIGLDNYAESGTSAELYDKYGLSALRMVSRLFGQLKQY